MANLGGTFDANTVEPTTPFEILPAGKYVAQIVQSEMRDTKSGTGQMLWLELEIVDGEFSGRRVFDRLNLVNHNAKAQEIAHRTLSAICRATGQMTVSDSEQLHMKPMQVTVKVRPATAEYQAQNEVGGYEATAARAAPRPVTGAVGAAPKAAPVQTAKPAASVPPWRRTA